MGLLFKKILSLGKRIQPSAQLREAYENLHILASNLKELLQELHQRQEELLIRTATPPRGQATGTLAVYKTAFIADEFIPKLEAIAQLAEKRWKDASREIPKEEPLSAEEEAEIERILTFIREVENALSAVGVSLTKNMPPRQELTKINDTLRTVTVLAEEFHQVERYEQQLIQKVLQQGEISPLLKEVYRNAKKETLSDKSTVLVYRFQSEWKFRQFEVAAEQLNKLRNPNFWVKWRKWWKDKHEPEVDATIPLGEHVNISIKLGPNNKKKEIHLIFQKQNP